MKVSDLQLALDKLPPEAEIWVAHIGREKFDGAIEVERVIVGGLRGSGGKVIAGIIRFKCGHP
jgi:hypothetical protein